MIVLALALLALAGLGDAFTIAIFSNERAGLRNE